MRGKTTSVAHWVKEYLEEHTESVNEIAGRYGYRTNEVLGKELSAKTKKMEDEATELNEGTQKLKEELDGLVKRFMPPKWCPILAAGDFPRYRRQSDHDISFHHHKPEYHVARQTDQLLQWICSLCSELVQDVHTLFYECTDHCGWTLCASCYDKVNPPDIPPPHLPIDRRSGKSDAAEKTASYIRSFPSYLLPKPYPSSDSIMDTIWFDECDSVPNELWFDMIIPLNKSPPIEGQIQPKDDVQDTS